MAKVFLKNKAILLSLAIFLSLSMGVYCYAQEEISPSSRSERGGDDSEIANNAEVSDSADISNNQQIPSRESVFSSISSLYHSAFSSISGATNSLLLFLSSSWTRGSSLSLLRIHPHLQPTTYNPQPTTYNLVFSSISSLYRSGISSVLSFYDSALSSVSNLPHQTAAVFSSVISPIGEASLSTFNYAASLYDSTVSSISNIPSRTASAISSVSPLFSLKSYLPATTAVLNVGRGNLKTFFVSPVGEAGLSGFSFISSLYHSTLSSISGIPHQTASLASSILSPIGDFFSSLFMKDRTATTFTEIIPLKNISSFSSSSAPSVIPAQAGIQSPSSPNPSPSSTYNPQPITYNLVSSSISRREVLDLLRQSEIKNNFLVNSSNSASALRTSLVNQTLSDLESKISLLEKQKIGQLDHIYGSISQSFSAIHSLDDIVLTNASFSGTTGTFTGLLSGVNASFSGNLSTDSQLTVSGIATSTLAGDTSFDSGTFYIDSINNRVGIASSSPSETLSVNGAAYLSQISAPSVSTDRLYNSSGDLYWNGNLIGSASVGNWTSLAGNVYRSSGNVGIGTTSPGSLLHIASATRPTITLETTGTTANARLLRAVPEEVTWSLNLFYNGSAWGQDDISKPSWRARFNTLADVFTVLRAPATAGTPAQVDLFTIKGDGNVGIGTTSPYSKLSVAGIGSFDDYLRASYFTATSTTATSTFAGGMSVAGTAGLTVLQNGNIGIGTTTPEYKLTINTATNDGITLYRDKSIRINLSNNSSGGYINLHDSSAVNTTKIRSYSIGGVEAFFNGGGNVGIGTTSPYAKLSVVGETVAQMFTATSTTANSTFAGNVGIGTTSPSTKLSIGGAAGDETGHGYFTGGLGVGVLNTVANSFRVGQCVTGDTKLRRRRRKIRSKKSNPKSEGEEADYIYDEVAIKDIKAGDEIASLDTKTNKIVWSKVKQLAYMGKKQTYRLSTEDGRQIRTTANHPYLTEQGWVKVSDLRQGMPIAVPRDKSKQKPRVGVFIDNANLFYAQRSAGWKVDIEKFASVSDSASLKFVKYFIALPQSNDNSFNATNKYISKIKKFAEVYIKQLKYIAVGGAIVKKGDIDVDLAIDAIRNIDEFDIALIVSGDSDYVALRDYLLEKGKKVVFAGFRDNLAYELKGGKYIAFDNMRKDIELGNSGNKKTPEYDLGRILLPLLYSSEKDLSNVSVKTPDSSVAWVKIRSIEPVAEEDVYDVEIENTHNFIGNDIIAHNTAFIVGADGKTGVGTSTPNWKLSVSGIGSFDDYARASYFTATSTTASTFPYASTTMISATTASTTNLIVSNTSTLGTVSSGLWNGTTVGVSYGGTGQTSWLSGGVLYSADGVSLTGTTTANLKTTLALNNVENTALSTWAGTTNITTLGTITSGTWNASLIGVPYGGTGWASIQSGSIPYGNGSSALSTTTAGTAGYVLAYLNGVPTWTATSTLATLSGTLSVAKGGTGQTSFGQGWLNSDGTTLSASTSPTVNYITATSTTATSTFAGGLAVETSGLVYDYSSNNVGIGTVAPSAGLDIVYNGLAQEINATLDDATGNEVAMQLNYTTNKLTSGNDTGLVINQTDTASPGTSDLLVLQASSVNKVRVNRDGTLYWGNVADAGRLSWDTNEALIYGQTGKGLSLGSNNQPNHLYINTSGNIGIGTTTPNNKLDIYSTTKSAIGFTGASGSTYKWTMGMDVSNGGRFSIASSTALGTTDRLVIDGNGNIGIGTTSPYAKLSVVGEAVAQMFTATSTTATSTFNGDINLGITTNLLQGGQRFLTSSTTSAGNLTIGYQSATNINANGGLGNTGVGYQAMGNATSTDYNTALGYQALKGSATISNAGYNTAVGYQALYNNTTGVNNTANGYQSLYLNTTGSYNTANGFNSLLSNTTGNYNIANGGASLQANTTGVNNTANGYASLGLNTTGTYNTANGMYSFRSNTTGVGNIGLGYYSGQGDGTTVDQRSVIDNYATFIGYQASRSEAIASTTALTNITAIGKNARVGASNSIVLGGTGSDAVNVAIGTTSPWSKLSIQNTYGSLTPLFDIASSTSATYATSSVFRVNADGNLGIGTTTPYAKLSVVGEAVAQMFTATSTLATSTFNGDINLGITTNLLQGGQRFLTSSTTSAGNLTIGYQSATNIDANGGLYNTGVGYQAMGNATSTSYNTALGYQALKGSATISNIGYNTAIGYKALSTNTTGNYNTANGYLALAVNTTGIQNTATGMQSLYFNTTGKYNTANGYTSLLANTTGERNTAIGYNSLSANTTGSYNTAIGYLTGYGDNTPDQRSVIDNYATFLGYQASRSEAVASTSALTNITAIGKNARVAVSNSIVLGGTGSDAVNVAIGTTSPWSKLSIQNTYGSLTPLLDIASSTSAAYATSSIFRINADGNIGIGTTSPNWKLSVAGIGSIDDYLRASYFTATSTTATSTLSTGGLAIGTNQFIVQQNSGKVALGTITPYHAKLTMTNGTGQYTGLNLINTGATIGDEARIDFTMTSAAPTDVAPAGARIGVIRQGTNAISDMYFSTNNSGGVITERMRMTGGGNVGIGTTSPYSKLSVWGSGTETGQLFELVNNASSTLLSVLDSGVFQYKSAATSTIKDNANYSWTIATSSTADPIFRIDTVSGAKATTSIIGGLAVDGGAINYDWSSGITSIDNLQLGALNFDTDAGIINWADMPVTSSATIGTAESYTAQIDGNPLLTVYAESDGAEGIQKGAIGIGTTSPYSRLSVWGLGTGTGQLFELVNNASTTVAKTLDNGTTYLLGNVGIATTSPWRTLSVTGTMAVTALTAGAAGDYAVCINNTTKEITNAGASGCVVSSKRFKENISALDSGLDELMMLKPSKFSYIGKSGEHIGLIAEDVGSVDKRLVEYEADGITPRTVRYMEISALLIKSIQELNVNLLNISSTTATTTQASQSFASGFFGNVFTRVAGWMADTTNGIGNVFAGTFRAKEKICVDDQCLTKDDVRVLLDLTRSGGQTASASSTSGNSSSSSVSSSASLSSSSVANSSSSIAVATTTAETIATSTANSISSSSVSSVASSDASSSSADNSASSSISSSSSQANDQPNANNSSSSNNSSSQFSSASAMNSSSSTSSSSSETSSSSSPSSEPLATP